MTFINERVSDDDAKKYDFEGLSKTLHTSLSNLLSRWTIDRDRNVFLIWLGRGQEEFAMQNSFLLWIEGQKITISLIESSKGNPFGIGTTTWDSLLFTVPQGCKFERAEVVSVLKEALTEFKWPGYGGQVVDHTAIFNF
jgi:hypothetical protein